MRFLRGASVALAVGASAISSPIACGGTDTPDTAGVGQDAGFIPIQTGDSGSSSTPSDDSGASSSFDSGKGSAADAGHGQRDAGSAAAETGAPGVPNDGGFPAGWLYTSEAKILLSDGSSGTPWMGRGVNIDDVYFCGYDNSLWMTTPDQTLIGIVKTMMATWKPTFVRLSLSMASYAAKISNWTTSNAYKTDMTNVIDAITAYPGVHVLVTVRSDSSMITDATASDVEATGLPTSAATTPNATQFPTGTDATYQALVDSFASNGSVLFGLSNEPGGTSAFSPAAISAAMSHAVGVIRAEEDKLGVPHHVVSVQGANYTSDISMYAKSPLPYDNLVYEVHGYPPPATNYTFASIPVILGEYGSLTDSTSFYADVESKQIPNLAWDFDPYNNCYPDLLNITSSTTNLVASTWGSTVQAYLLAH